MKRLVRQTGAWCRLSARAVLRRPAVVGLLVIATAATGLGAVFQPFNFGHSPVDFLASVGWALRVMVVVALSLSLAVQIFQAHEDSGVVSVALARGVSPGAIVAGQTLAVALMVAGVGVISGLIVAVGSGVVTWRGQGMSALMLSTMGLLVALVVQVVGTLSRATGFLIAVSMGIVGLGFMRPLALDVGGVGAWLAMLAPDFAWLGEFAWSTGAAGWDSVFRAWVSSAVYMGVLGWLAVRGLGRREF